MPMVLKNNWKEIFVPETSVGVQNFIFLQIKEMFPYPDVTTAA